jgi:hypothetical protein
VLVETAGQLAQQRLGDLAVGRDDDLAGLAVDHVERDLLAEQDVGERLGELLASAPAASASCNPPDLLDLAAAVGGAELLLLEVDAREETFTSMTMP